MIDWLELVFKVLQEAGLALKPLKCKFAMTQIEYLELVISSDDVKSLIEIFYI